MQTLFSGNKTNQKGFTLVEIVIVLVILIFIATIGTTMLMNYLPNMRLRSATRDIYSALMQAKTEAIRRGENVSLLFDSPNNNYTMFLDTDSDNTIDAGETVLVSTTALTRGVTFDTDPVVVADGDGVSFTGNTAVFSMRGLPIGTGTVGLCASDSQGNTIRQRQVVVSIAGRINIQ